MSRAGLCALALLVMPLAAPAQQRSRAHMEACTEWRYPGNRIGTRNDCNRPVTIRFLAFNDGHVVEADVEPGDWFDSGATTGTTNGYIFTVCPVGYVPSVSFSMENRTTIEESLYNCLPSDKPGV